MLFDPCNRFTDKAEGGWSDDPDDPGGATYRGATLAAYRDWMDDPTFSKEQLRALTSAELWAFFHARYRLPVSGDKLPAGVDLVTYDFGVNAGIRRSGMILQAAVGAQADGAIGPKTLALVAGKNDRVGLIQTLTAAHEAWYRKLPTFAEFGHGWINRLMLCQTTALAMIRGRAVQRCRMGWIESRLQHPGTKVKRLRTLGIPESDKV